jgi:hypothetical protein
MSIKIIGTTLLAAAGLCGTAAVWSHTHDSHAVEERGNRRGARVSRREHRGSNFARDFTRRGTYERRGGDAAWDDRTGDDRSR